MTTFFLSTRQTCERFDCSESFLKAARRGGRGKSPLLREGIHWVSFGGHVRYNAALIEDFLVNRKNPTAHQRAIDAYLASLPSSQAAA